MKHVSASWRHHRGCITPTPNMLGEFSWWCAEKSKNFHSRSRASVAAEKPTCVPHECHCACPDWFFFFSAFSVNFRSSLKGLFTFLFPQPNQILSGFKSITTVSRSRLPKEFYQVRGVWGRRVKGRRKKRNAKAKNSIFSRSGLCGCFVLAPSFKEWGGAALFHSLYVAIIDPFPSWRCTRHSYM